jgi:hypothetical protein
VWRIGQRHFLLAWAGLLSLALASACGGGGSGPSYGAPASSPATQPAVSQSAAATSTASPQRATSSGSAPIEFTYLGLTDDKTQIHYVIKVTSDKEIEQVDLNIRYLDAAGKTLDEGRYLWQNIVKSTSMPILPGKTYDVQDYLYPGAVKAEVKLLRVVFKDLTYWDAPG